MLEYWVSCDYITSFSNGAHRYPIQALHESTVSMATILILKNPQRNHHTLFLYKIFTVLQATHENSISMATIIILKIP